MALPQQAFVVLVDLVLHLPLLQKVVRRARFRKILLNVMYFFLDLIICHDAFSREFNQFLDLGQGHRIVCLLASCEGLGIFFYAIVLLRDYFLHFLSLGVVV